MSSDIGRRLVRGIVATSASQVVKAVTQLVAVPLLLGAWGTELYGAWLIVGTVPWYLSMSDAGFASAAANVATFYLVRGERDKALRTLHSSWVFVTALSLGGLSLLLGIVWYFPIEQWLNIGVLGHRTTALTISYLSLYVVVTLQESVLSGAYRALGLYARSTTVSTIIKGCELIVLVVSASAGLGPDKVALALLIVLSIGQLCNYKILQMGNDWVSLRSGHFSWKEIKGLSGSAIAFQGFPVTNALTNQGIVTIIGIAAGASTVVVFSTVRTLVNSIRQIVAVINSNVWPELSMAFGKGSVRVIRELHGYACQASLWVALILSLILYFSRDWVLSIWTHGRVHADSLFFSLLLLGVVVNSVWSASMVLPSATNRHHRVSLLFLLISVASILGIVLVASQGLTGVALVLLAMEVIMSVVVMNTSLRIVRGSVGRFLLEIARPDLASILNRLVGSRVGERVSDPIDLAPESRKVGQSSCGN